MGELVSKTSSAVAVDENLTTLIDWVNIEHVSGFTVIIDNAGGGSADDITDVQIDTSNDGGTTVSTDQHAGVPAVPIASAKASVGTFTETANFVRVRALCAAGTDTTADVVLLADTAAARICTLTDVKDRLGLSTTDHDSMLCRLILNLEDIFNSYCSRTLILNSVDVTEYYTGGSAHLKLKRYPVVSITSIKVAVDYDFTSATALTADSDYRLIDGGKKGILYRLYSNWYEFDDSIQVIYKGGYCSAGQTPGSGEFALPNDLREAAIEQVSFLFKRRDDIGLASVGFEGGSINKFSPMDLLPMVQKVLDDYVRRSLP